MTSTKFKKENASESPDILDTFSEMATAFSEKFRVLRSQHGYTQKHLADILRVSRGTLCSWERADSLPYFDTLNEICKLFHVSCDYILGIEKTQAADFSQIYDKYVIECNKTKYLNISSLSDENLTKLLALFSDLILSQNE